MRNAQKNAIMAMFATMDQDEDAEEAVAAAEKSSEQSSSRLIEVDLLALARGRMLKAS